MPPPSNVKLIYKRLETDAEFAQRVNNGPMYYQGSFDQVVGDALDEAIWNIFGKQRRIIEVVPK